MAQLWEMLNPQQLEAVHHLEGPLLVLAGAGSGKTRVLTNRIAYLLTSGKAAVENILAITFTNKAAEEMRQRLHMLVGYQAREVWVATFHATCARILRQEAPALGYARHFTIYDTADQLSLLKICLKELNFSEQRFPPREMAATINRAKNHLLTTEDFDRQAAGYYQVNVAQVYRLYQQKLRQLNAMDFDDLLMQVVLLFRRFPDILARYQQRFRYILVDEYQDTNHAQYVFVNLLARGHRNLCVVGDDDQSIYRWRGADIRNILEFEHDYPEARVVKLEQNYRSTSCILEAANGVIKNNAGRKEKRLWTSARGGDPVFYYVADGESGEARFVSGEIRRLHEQGYAWSDLAVLYRTHAQSRVLEEQLVADGVPYQIVGGLRFYERKEIKDLLAYLRVLVNPDDRLSLARIINVPRRGIGQVSWARIEGYAAREQLSLDTALHRAGEITGLTPAVIQAARRFTAFVDTLREQMVKISVTELVQRLLEESGYLAELQAEGTVEAVTRLENLQEFLSVTTGWDRENPGGNLEGFLTQISLTTDIDSFRGDDAVTLMTLHAAKGLEFRAVFLTGLEEGVFPHSRSLDDPDELEEERRLCYVGLTRAKERLYLSRACYRMLYGSTEANPPSRFLMEIPEHLLEQVAGVPVAEDTGVLGGGEAEAGPDGASFRPGDRVNHDRWGEGVVTGVEGQGRDQVIHVTFPQGGDKALIRAYAPLRKI